MKKLILFLLLIAMIVLTSCQTSVGISYMVPSEIDMGTHRNIALASTVPYDAFPRPSRYIRTIDSLSRHGYANILTSYDRSLRDDVAAYATKRIYSTLTDSGYFSVLPPSVTDKILDAGSVGLSSKKALKERGIDAVIIPRIENMSIDEYIYSRTTVETRENSKGEEYRVDVTRFYYDADYYLTLSYTIVDVDSERIIAKRKFVVDDSDNFRITDHNFLVVYPERFFSRMIDSLMGRITRQLVPLRTSVDITLMDNKPKSEAAEEAYKAVKDDNLLYARDIFLRNYDSTRHVPSGYNASLLTAAVGDVDGAIELASRVYNDSGNSDVYALLSRLNAIKKSNEESIRQLEGIDGDDASYYENTSSIYDALRR